MKNRDLFDQHNQMCQSIERLNVLCDVIEKYGISSPIMETADPYNELIKANICPVQSYEELSTVPENNEIADVTVEGIIDKLRSWLISKLIVIKKIDKEINDLTFFFDDDSFHGDIDLLKGYRIAFTQQLHKYDEEAFKKTPLYNNYSRNRFKAILNDTLKLIAIVERSPFVHEGKILIDMSNTHQPNMEVLDKSIINIFNYMKPHMDLLSQRFDLYGFEHKIDTPARFEDIKFHILNRGEGTDYDKSGFVGDSWNAKELVKAIDELLKLLSMIPKVESLTERLSSFDGYVYRALTARKSLYEKLNREESIQHHKIINQVYDMIHNEYILLDMLCYVMNNLNNCVWSLAFRLSNKSIRKKNNTSSHQDASKRPDVINN